MGVLMALNLIAQLRSPRLYANMVKLNVFFQITRLPVTGGKLGHIYSIYGVAYKQFAIAKGQNANRSHVITFAVTDH